jgi:transposase-like protein
MKKKTCSEVKCIACNGKGKVKRIVRNVLSDKQKNNILSLYRKGYGIREIQRELKISHPYTVTYYIKTCNKEL